ncbi:hormonally up-regulated neu tumor-associated kinase [Lampetra fluviatilis]
MALTAGAPSPHLYSHTKRVGQYILGRVLGEGAFAKVREAIHCPTGEKVAIKVLDKARVRGDPYLSRAVRREAAVQRRAGAHVGLCRLLHALDSPGALYLVLELCARGDLGSRLAGRAGGALGEPRARGYARQLLAAAAHLHARGVVHRDLKIENMLLDEDDNIKIIDFGLSNELATCGGGGPCEGALLLTQCGSPAYAAPEILSQKPYGTPADVWSLGVSLFVMLTGTLPFTVEPFNIRALLTKILTDSMNPIPAHLSADAVRFTKSLLNPDPALRPSAREALTDAWLHQDTPPPQCPPSRTLHPQCPPSRPEPLDAHVLRIMADSMGVWPAEVAAAVSANQSGALLTTYFLLCQRERRRARTEKTVKKTLFDGYPLDREGPRAVDPGGPSQPITERPRAPSSQSGGRNEIQTEHLVAVDADRGDRENPLPHPDRGEQGGEIRGSGGGEIRGIPAGIVAAPMIYRRMSTTKAAERQPLNRQRRLTRATQVPPHVSPQLPGPGPTRETPSGRLPPLSPALPRLLPSLRVTCHGEGGDGIRGGAGGSGGGGVAAAGTRRWRLVPGRAKPGVVGEGAVAAVTFELLPPVSEVFKRSRQMGGGV